jgi:hypothetical protein
MGQSSVHLKYRMCKRLCLGVELPNADTANPRRLTRCESAHASSEVDPCAYTLIDFPDYFSRCTLAGSNASPINR